MNHFVRKIRTSLSSLCCALMILSVLPTISHAEDPFVGEIKMFAGNFAPRGYAFCNGQLLAINGNEALFSLLGTTYGGDGRTSFALPDLRGRVAIHAGNGPGLSDKRLGEKGGVETVVLNQLQMPSHDHSAAGRVVVNTGEGNQTVPKDNFLAKSGDGAPNYSDSLSTTPPEEGPADTTAANSVLVTVENKGGNQPHSNMQPFTTINYIIALVGIYPSRS